MLAFIHDANTCLQEQFLHAYWRPASVVCVYVQHQLSSVLGQSIEDMPLVCSSLPALLLTIGMIQFCVSGASLTAGINALLMPVSAHQHLIITTISICVTRLFLLLNPCIAD